MLGKNIYIKNTRPRMNNSIFSLLLKDTIWNYSNLQNYENVMLELPPIALMNNANCNNRRYCFFSTDRSILFDCYFVQINLIRLEIIQKYSTMLHQLDKIEKKWHWRDINKQYFVRVTEFKLYLERNTLKWPFLIFLFFS